MTGILGTVRLRFNDTQTHTTNSIEIEMDGVQHLEIVMLMHLKMGTKCELNLKLVLALHLDERPANLNRI